MSDLEGDEWTEHLSTVHLVHLHNLTTYSDNLGGIVRSNYVGGAAHFLGNQTTFRT